MLIVMKFGGSLLDDGKKLLNVRNIINTYFKSGDQLIIIVSALGGITDKILNLCKDVKKINKRIINDFVTEIEIIHTDLVGKMIIHPDNKNEVLRIISNLLNEFKEILVGVSILGEITPKSRDYLVSFGERLSAPIISFILTDISLKSVFFNGKEVGILTDSNYGDAKPLMDTTKLRVRHKLEPILKQNNIPVITGFIGSDQNGNITTIGRGGSDYSATIIASSINADEIWLWTDVDGLMTADPQIVENAITLDEVSFPEALELSMFGPKSMHPRALEPVMDSKISVRIRNVNNLNNKGTAIIQNPSNYKIVKSITAIKNIALIDVSGGGLIGYPGTAAKIFEALAINQINIIMISQTPSEASISLIVKKNDLDNAITTLELNFLGKLIKRLEVNENVAIISVVGSGMRGLKGVAARTFSAVAKKNINVIMIAQGSSELNLAFVIDEKNCEEAVKVLHKEFIVK